MKKPDLLSLFTLSCASLIIATASLVMMGWLTHNAQLIQVSISYAPMQFNTAICFIACASGIICMHNGLQRAAFLLGAFVSLFAALTLSQYLFKLNYGIDTLFITPFTTMNVISIGRMAPNTALAFVLSGLALFVCTFSDSHHSRRGFVVALLGSLVLSIGAVPFLGYISGVTAAYTWGTFVHMALHTCACFILLGMLILTTALRSSAHWEKWIPFPVFIGLMVATVALSGAVRSQQDIEFTQQIQLEADNLAHEAEARLNELYQSLDRIAGRWDAAGGTPQNLWESDAVAYLKGYPFLAGLSYADADTKVQWLVTRTPEKNSKTLGFHLNSEPVRAQAVRRAMESHAPQTTPVVNLIGGGKGFLYITPLYSHSHFDGLLIAVFRVDSFLGTLLTQGNFHDYYVTVEDKNRLFSTLPPGYQHPWPWVRNAQFITRQTSWNIALSPTPQLFRQRNSSVPLVLLIVGTVTALLITLCIFLALKWRQNAHILELRERALEKSNSINNAILSSAAYLIVATDNSGIIIVFNREAERTLGYSADEVIGKMTPAAWHDKEEVHSRAEEMSRESGETVEPGFEVMVKNARERGVEQREWTYMRKDGTRFPAELLVTPLKDNDGNILGYLGIIQDITERRRQQEALKTSEEKFRLALEHTPIGMALVSPTGAFMQVNKALCDIIGYTKNEMLKLDFQSITHPDDLNADLNYFYRILAGEIQTYQMEKRYIHKSGRIVIILHNVALVRNGNGSPAYFISQIQDITERKRAELELKSSEAFNRSLMDASADCVKVLDTRGRLLRMNKPGECIMEIDDFEAIRGSDWWTLWPSETQVEVKNSIRVASTGGQYRFQAFCPTAKGTPKWWDVQVSPVSDPDGTIVHLLSVSRDITESKEVERMKNEFISTVSHELRTPLTSIRGSLGLIAGGVAGDMSPKARDLLQIAYKNSERLVRLINNILDIEKIESGRMNFELRTIEVAALLKQAVEETQGYANKYGVTVEMEDSAHGASISGDYDRLMQVLNNLISNAVKYSPASGKVTIASQRLDGKIRVSVSDTGPGIPPDFQKRIFGKFAQADSSDTRQKGGTGLGLSISRAIIESMDGTIDFASVPGNTVFHFQLAEHHSNVQAVGIAGRSPEKGAILICEDDPDIASLLRMIMLNEGFSCDIAASGEEAKQRLKDKSYAAMTLDLGLPGQDGISLIRELRLDEKTATLPIIVVSASAESGKKTLNGEAIGILDWLPKPIDIDRIRRVLKIIVPEGKPLILHVEDDDDIVSIIRATLMDDALIIPAATLHEARLLLDKHNFDLVLLDQNLPDGNGISLLPELSARALPIIILSVDETAREIQDRVAACLVKSVASEDKIIQTIRNFVSRHKEPV